MHSNSYRFNPPVKHLSFKVDEKISSQKLLENIQEQLPAQVLLSRALWHGGIFLNTKRLSEASLPGTFSKGDLLELYYFLREPEEISINEKDILWQEEGMLAVNKAAWLPTQGSRSSIRFGLQEQVRKYTQVNTFNAIHRLDRQTSGIVLFASNPKSEALLMKLFHDKKIEKKYLAYVSPLPQIEEWEMKGYLQRDFRKLPLNIYRFYHREQKNSRLSHTHFKVLKSFASTALISATPFTGRTHQIRVHLSYSGYPILGDDLYGGKTKDAERILLHAHQLRFCLKIKNQIKEINLESAPPDDFKPLSPGA